MKNNQASINKIIEEDSIDIFALLKKVWSERRLLIKSLLSFFFLGCLIALLSPVVYTSQTTFVPQVSSDEAPDNNRLGSLASLAGINLNTTKKVLLGINIKIYTIKNFFKFRFKNFHS